MSTNTESTKFKPFDLGKILHRLLIIILIGVAGNLVFAFYSTATGPVELMHNFAPEFLVLAFLLAIAPWLGHGIRIILWSRMLGKQLSFREAMKISVATDLGAAITPTVVGGAPIKLGLLVQAGFRPGIAATLVALGSFEELLFYLITVPVALTLNLDLIMPYIQEFTTGLAAFAQTASASLSIFVVVSIFLVPTYRKTRTRKGLFTKIQSLSTLARRKLTDLKQDIRDMSLLIWRQGKLVFLMSFGFTCLQWFCRYAVLNSLIMGLGINSDHVQIFLRQWLVFAAMIIVPTPGATGGAELAFYHMFESILPLEAIAVVLAGWRFLTYYMIMLVAVVIVLLLSRIPKRIAKTTVVPL